MSSTNNQRVRYTILFAVLVVVAAIVLAISGFLLPGKDGGRSSQNVGATEFSETGITVARGATTLTHEDWKRLMKAL